MLASVTLYITLCCNVLEASIDVFLTHVCDAVVTYLNEACVRVLLGNCAFEIFPAYRALTHFTVTCSRWRHLRDVRSSLVVKTEDKFIQRCRRIGWTGSCFQGPFSDQWVFGCFFFSVFWEAAVFPQKNYCSCCFLRCSGTFAVVCILWMNLLNR